MRCGVVLVELDVHDHGLMSRLKLRMLWMKGGSPRPRGQWYRQSILKGWMCCCVVRWTAVGWWFHSVSSAMARLAAHAGVHPGDKRVPIFPATFCPCTYIDTSSSHNATTPSPFLASPIPSPRAAHSISAGWLRLPNFASGPPSSLEPSCVLHATIATDDAGKEGRRDKTTAKREKRGARQWHGQQWSVSCRGAEQARRTDAFEHRRRSRGPGTAPMRL